MSSSQEFFSAASCNYSDDSSIDWDAVPDPPIPEPVTPSVHPESDAFLADVAAFHGPELPSGHATPIFLSSTPITARAPTLEQAPMSEQAPKGARAAPISISSSPPSLARSASSESLIWPFAAGSQEYHDDATQPEPADDAEIGHADAEMIHEGADTDHGDAWDPDMAHKDIDVGHMKRNALKGSKRLPRRKFVVDTPQVPASIQVLVCAKDAGGGRNGHRAKSVKTNGKEALECWMTVHSKEDSCSGQCNHEHLWYADIGECARCACCRARGLDSACFFFTDVKTIRLFRPADVNIYS
ncbi:uncharacterized protein PAC_19290 [Phialocephala subalpina]|uniref:Uncharacterized protein n=1 Tax=Phialocephala subalpina TaxID=576137 RepID=A0A1L7XWL8_9HELO|nr:uncharacterized protein PAC_19290 [Phialocephala subalpina]